MKKKRRLHRSAKRIGHRVLGMGGIIAVAILAVGALIGTTAYVHSYLQSGQMAAVISSTLVRLANEDRADDDLGSLAVNPELAEAAQAKADDMAANGYFAHTSPDGKNSWYWFKQAGYRFSYAGENLAVDFSDSDDVEKAWMNSPTHRANILNTHFTEIGIATAVGTYEGHKATFVVQMFGAPAAGPTGPVETVNVPKSAQEIAVAKSDVLGEAAKAPPPAAAAPEPSSSAANDPMPAAVQVSADPPQLSPDIGFWDRLAAAPKAALRDFYLLVGLVLLVALLSITGVELKRHHMRHVAIAGFLILFMGGLYAAASWYVFAPPVLAEATALAAP